MGSRPLLKNRKVAPSHPQPVLLAPSPGREDEFSDAFLHFVSFSHTQRVVLRGEVLPACRTPPKVRQHCVLQLLTSPRGNVNVAGHGGADRDRSGQEATVWVKM